MKPSASPQSNKLTQEDEKTPTFIDPNRNVIKSARNLKTIKNKSLDQFKAKEK